VTNAKQIGTDTVVKGKPESELEAKANADKDSKNLGKGLDYLEMAGKQDDMDAVRSYYDIVVTDHGNRANVKKALGFCQKLIDTATDSYDKEQLAIGYKTLKEKYKSKGKLVPGMLVGNIVKRALQWDN